MSIIQIANPRRVLQGFDDQQGLVTTATLGPAVWTMDNYRDTGFPLPCLRHDQNDEVGLVFQFTHRKKLASNVKSLHMHYIPLANTGGNLYFTWAYCWINLGDELPAIASWTSGNTTIPVASGDQFKSKISSLITNISPVANEGYSSELFIKLIRSGTDPLDTYSTNKSGGTPAANLALTYLDCHISLDRGGSINEYLD